MARTDAPITSYFAQVADDPSVQLVCREPGWPTAAGPGRARRTRSCRCCRPPRAVLVGRAGGWNNYTDIPAGPWRCAMWPTCTSSQHRQGGADPGAQVREWLEMSASQFNHIDPKGPAEQPLVNESFRTYNFDTLDGVSYRIGSDAAGALRPRRQTGGLRRGASSTCAARQPADRREGRSSSSSPTITAPRAWRLPGLDGSNIVLDAPDENRQALAQYLAGEKRIDPSADNNWHIASVPGVKLQFTSGTGVKIRPPRHPRSAW